MPGRLDTVPSAHSRSLASVRFLPQTCTPIRGGAKCGRTHRGSNRALTTGISVWFQRFRPLGHGGDCECLGMWRVASQIWLNSDSNELSQSWVRLAKLGFKLSRSWVNQESQVLTVELSQNSELNHLDRYMNQSRVSPKKNISRVWFVVIFTAMSIARNQAHVQKGDFWHF